MRLSPDVLVLELFREIFFAEFSGGRETQLDPHMSGPGGPVFSEGERVVLAATRGRQKRTRGSTVTGFFTPAYPALARSSWLRRQSDRVVRDHLFSGPIAQHFRKVARNRSAPELTGWADSVITGLLGTHTATAPTEVKNKELLSVPILGSGTVMDRAASRDRLIEKIPYSSEGRTRTFSLGGADDPLSETIFRDFSIIVELEARIPRLEWLQYLKTYLRLALSCWVLAHMRTTVMVRDWLVGAASGEGAVQEKDVIEAIAQRHHGLLRPTQTPSTQVDEHVEDYVRARIELSLLLPRLAKLTGEPLDEAEIVVDDFAAGKVSVARLAELASTVQDPFHAEYPGGPRPYLARIGESFDGWRRPRRVGVGKNLDEFLRVLKRSGPDDGDHGYLLTPARGRGRMGATLFPGPSMIKMMVMLAAHRHDFSRGRLVLADLEEQFLRYGIDFATTLAARPRLVRALSELGLFSGSPDAGDSAAITAPFRH